MSELEHREGPPPPRRKVAFLAPGQGVTSWEDGLTLLDEGPKTAQIYEEVYDATGVDIIGICQRNEPVVDTSIVQPAAVGIGYARSTMLQEVYGIKPDLLLPISSGEFTVAAISGALSLKDASQTAQDRGHYQNQAAGGKGGALIVIHTRRALRVKKILEGIEGAHASGYNTPIKTTFSYIHDAYQPLVDSISQQPGVKRIIPIKNLNFPPHGPAVEKAQEWLAERFEGVEMKDATIAMISTRTARIMKKARTIKHNMIWQTTTPTNLRGGVELAIRQGIQDFFDLGPGNSMTRSLEDFDIGPDIRVNPALS